MTFTDEDLKWLKELCKLKLPMKLTRCSKVAGLIARLEAAEDIAEDHSSIYPNDPATIRWRNSKAAGK